MVKSDKVKLKDSLKLLHWLSKKKPAYSSFPELDPKNQLIYTSREAIRALRVSSKTFYRHIKRLGFTPYGKKRNRCRYWSYDQLLDIMMSIYNPISIRSQYEKYRESSG